MYCCLRLIYTRCEWFNEWKTEKRHKCANMGKVKRLELWWQLYLTSLLVRDLKNYKPMDFCSTECTHIPYFIPYFLCQHSKHNFKFSIQSQPSSQPWPEFCRNASLLHIQIFSCPWPYVGSASRWRQGQTNSTANFQQCKYVPNKCTVSQRTYLLLLLSHRHQ